MQQQNILTFVRTNDKIKKAEDVTLTNNTIKIKDKEYYVDKVMNNMSQRDVYESLEDFVIKNVENGFNCSVFAYGQTGSGKTYTILGEPENEGLVVRTLRHLHMSHKKVKISFIEIYNEEINDLNNLNRNLILREEFDDKVNSLDCMNRTNVVIDNLSIYEATSFEDSYNFYVNAFNNRKTASTNYNEQSSRSHAVFTIYLEQGTLKNGVMNGLKQSKLVFVDLAGSEKVDLATEDKFEITCSFKETTQINKSLMNLGILVNSLGRKETKHLPYRDSKLTFLLKDSLGGNSKLCVIGNVNLSNINDSISTLQFLKRIKKIKNSPTINYTKERNAAELLEFLEKENLRLIEHSKLCESASIYSRECRINLNKIKEGSKKAREDIDFIRKTLKDIKNLYFEQPGAFERAIKAHDEFKREVKETTAELIKNTLEKINKQ